MKGGRRTGRRLERPSSVVRGARLDPAHNLVDFCRRERIDGRLRHVAGRTELRAIRPAHGAIERRCSGIGGTAHGNEHPNHSLVTLGRTHTAYPEASACDARLLMACRRNTAGGRPGWTEDRRVKGAPRRWSILGGGDRAGVIWMRGREGPRCAAGAPDDRGRRDEGQDKPRERPAS